MECNPKIVKKSFDDLAEGDYAVMENYLMGGHFHKFTLDKVLSIDVTYLHKHPYALIGGKKYYKHEHNSFRVLILESQKSVKSSKKTKGS